MSLRILEIHRKGLWLEFLDNIVPARLSGEIFHHQFCEQEHTLRSEVSVVLEVRGLYKTRVGSYSLQH